MILIHWQQSFVRAFAVSGGSSRIDVEATVEISAEESATEIGRLLSENLVAHVANRGKVIVAVERGLLDWQHLSLPPCPHEDLPDLVRLQADYSFNGNDDSAGLDFLPLVGSTTESHRVWTVSLVHSQLVRIRKVLDIADLKAEHIVPVSLGWPALAANESASPDGTIYLAPFGEEPTIWSQQEERLVLFRQLQLPAASSESFGKSVLGELRRTQLALSQQDADGGKPHVCLIGQASADMAQLREFLSEQLRTEVPLTEPRIALPHREAGAELAAPLTGLANSVLSGDAPQVDLLNPRRRPAPKTRRETYYLATAAVVLLVLLVGLLGYRNLQAPLDRAAEMQAEIDLLKENTETLKQAEKEAAEIRTWLSKSVNLLDELRTISRHVRSEPLDAEDFPEDDDVVVGKIELSNRQYTVTAFTKQNSDLQPVEYRLRDGIHRVRRGETQRSDEVSGYPVKFESIVDVLESAASEEGGTP